MKKHITLKTVTFQLAASEAQSVAVAGSFNHWDPKAHPLKPGTKKGLWSRSLKLKPGRYEYRFVINGSQWVNDPNAKECCPNDQGSVNCVLHV